MKLTDLQNVAVPLAITYRDFQIELTYFPEKYFSDEVQDQLAAMADEAAADAPTEQKPGTKQRAAEQRRNKADSELLVKLIASWNIADDGGQVLPITADALLKLGFVLRKVIAREIYADIARPLAPAAS
jgi:hypothetical protein